MLWGLKSHTFAVGYALPPGRNDKPRENGAAPTVNAGRGAERGTMTNDDLRRVVRAEKKRQGKTWRQIHEESGIAATTIGNFCLGTRNTSITVITAILDALGLELYVRRKKHDG